MVEDEDERKKKGSSCILNCVWRVSWVIYDMS